MTPSHTELAKVLEKHIWYELARFVAQYELLRAPGKHRTKLDEDEADIVEDALIVSFCTHARNALEFFWRPDRSKYNYALATDYADASYVRLDKEKTEVKRLYEQLCAQINHLSLNRTDKSHQKIGEKQRDELVGIIHDEVARLVKHHLKPGFDKRYFAVERLAEAKLKSMTISVGSGGATNTARTLPSVSHTTAPPHGGLGAGTGPTAPARPPGS
jgi:hypothetical protein